MQNNKNMWAGLVVVLVVVLAVGGFVKMKKEKMERYNAPGYSVVYLVTGEVYIGHLSVSRDLELKDSYILQLNKNATDPTKSNFQLQPINEALWAPSSLHLMAKSVVFYGPILPTSKIAQALAAKH